MASMKIFITYSCNPLSCYSIPLFLAFCNSAEQFCAVFYMLAIKLPWRHNLLLRRLSIIPACRGYFASHCSSWRCLLSPLSLIIRFSSLSFKIYKYIEQNKAWNGALDNARETHEACYYIIFYASVLQYQTTTLSFKIMSEVISVRNCK